MIMSCGSIFIYTFAAEPRQASSPFAAFENLAVHGARPLVFTPANDGHWVARGHQMVQELI